MKHIFCWLDNADGLHRTRDARIPTHIVRYEDLQTNAAAHLPGILAFLLPPDEMPSSEAMRCAAERDHNNVSRKGPKILRYIDRAAGAIPGNRQATSCCLGEL